jgi:type II secretory pathway pseudopilin PulG
METTDPWESARSRAREEVRAAFAERRVVCPGCGHEQVAEGRSCSHCGAPYVQLRDPGMSRRTRRRILIGALAALVVLGGAAAIIVPSVQQEKHSADARARAADRAALARERRRIALDQRLHTARASGLHGLSRAQLTARLRSDLQASITADARARAKAGTLNGPILRTQCSAASGGGGGPPLGRYSCTAVNGEIVRKTGQAPAGVLGYPFWAIVDFKHLRYSWCKLNPRAGEGSATPSAIDLAVPVPRGCDITRG